MKKEKKPEKVRTPKPAVVPATPVEEKKEIQVIERIIESEVAPQDVFGKLTRVQIDLIKRTIAKGASDDELKIFIQVCKGAQLNPFLKQVFLVPRWDSVSGKETRTIQVSIDGFRSIAESSAAYAGNDDPTFGEDAEVAVKDKAGKVIKTITAPKSATVSVYKVVGGNRYPFTATARWAEYYPGDRVGFQWHIRPYLMLGKCAEALALRKAFPKLLSGMYEEAELANSNQPVQPQINEPANKVFESLKDLIKLATLPQLMSYKKKLEEPGEKAYTEVERKELLEMVGARIVELNEIPIV